MMIVPINTDKYIEKKKILETKLNILKQFKFAIQASTIPSIENEILELDSLLKDISYFNKISSSNSISESEIKKMLNLLKKLSTRE